MDNDWSSDIFNLIRRINNLQFTYKPLKKGFYELFTNNN